MRKKIYVLTDYRDLSYSTTTRRNGIDLSALTRYFDEYSYDTEFIKINEIDFRKDKFNNKYIFYPTSEDIGLHYKSYIEDILLGLMEQGAILIPDFKYFRAHHNKVFMEMLRDLSSIDELKSISSNCFGVYEDFIKKIPEINVPVVMKPAAGASSDGVILIKSKSKIKKCAKRVSRSFLPLIFGLKDYIASIIYKDYKRCSNHRKKFIVQNFIANLSGDFKVLIFDKKYYILRRQIRKNDFRASGSGLFEWPETVSNQMLNYCKKIYDSFDVPFISLDIAYDNQNYHLIEFQFISFGCLTMQKSKFYFTNIDNEWEKIEEVPILEKEIAVSITNYLNIHAK